MPLHTITGRVCRVIIAVEDNATENHLSNLRGEQKSIMAENYTTHIAASPTLSVCVRFAYLDRVKGGRVGLEIVGAIWRSVHLSLGPRARLVTNE